MMIQRKNAGFTLIELMIVVAIIAIIASVAIPKLLSARLSANESAAISTLRSLSSSQAQVQSSGAVDTDGDGSGEYAYFAELAGSVPVRVSAAGAPAAGVAGTDNLSPAVMSSAFGSLSTGFSHVARSGYLYQVWLPAATVGGAVAGIAEDIGAGVGTGGKQAGPFPDPDNGEVMWCAYAWPITVNQTGNRVFFMNQEGDLLQTLNRGAAPYSGTATPPPYDAVFSVANDMSSPLGINGIAANDGNTWTPVQ
jgi:prepilin-type N-terminal cleavage/methylation domain-containing protein